MSKTDWSRLATRPHEAHLVMVALPQDDADELHRGVARAASDVLARACGKLGEGDFAVAINRPGTTTEIHCLFRDADQARRVAEALGAQAIEAGPWASCSKAALDEDTHNRALLIAGPGQEETIKDIVRASRVQGYDLGAVPTCPCCCCRLYQAIV